MAEIVPGRKSLLPQLGIVGSPASSGIDPDLVRTPSLPIEFTAKSRATCVSALGTSNGNYEFARLRDAGGSFRRVPDTTQ